MRWREEDQQRSLFPSTSTTVCPTCGTSFVASMHVAKVNAANLQSLKSRGPAQTHRTTSTPCTRRACLDTDCGTRTATANRTLNQTGDPQAAKASAPARGTIATFSDSASRQPPQKRQWHSFDVCSALSPRINSLTIQVPETSRASRGKGVCKRQREERCLLSLSFRKVDISKRQTLQIARKNKGFCACIHRDQCSKRPPHKGAGCMVIVVNRSTV